MGICLSFIGIVGVVPSNKLEVTAGFCRETPPVVDESECNIFHPNHPNEPVAKELV